MTQAQLDLALSEATGESVRTIRRRGFSILDLRAGEFDPEPNDLPPQVVDWDALALASR